MEGNHESTESNPQIKVEWKKDDDSDIEDLFIRFEESSYHALLVDGVL